MTWEQTKQRFCQQAFRVGIRETAEALPAHPTTVYRIIAGQTQRPHSALKASIERFVHESEKLPSKS